MAGVCAPAGEDTGQDLGDVPVDLGPDDVPDAVDDTADLADGDRDVDVSDLECPTCVAQVVASAVGDHTCAVRRDGRTLCWGENAFGQLGDPMRLIRRAQHVAVDLPLPEGPISLSLGDNHTCVAYADGVWCWGGNEYGQLARGGTANSRPQPIAAVDSPGAVAAGTAFTCVTDASGVRCAGLNEVGQVGMPPDRFFSTQSLTPVPGIFGASGPLSAGSSFACALKDGDPDEVVCWGSNFEGQLGVTPNEFGCELGDCFSPTPRTVDVNRPVAVDAGDRHACALLMSGELRCWGANDAGQMGGGDVGPPRPPTAPLDVATFDQVSAGGGHTCAVAGNTAYCWGANGANQASSAQTAEVTSPQRALVGVHRVAAGGDFSCAIENDPDRQVACWGANANYQLGTELVEQSAEEIRSGLQNATQIAAGRGHACAVSGGSLRCWGDNRSGQLGDGVPIVRPTPFPLEPGFRFDQVSVGSDHTCGLRGGDVFCWGSGSNGELGRGGLAPSPFPVQVDVPDVRFVAAGLRFSCALDGAGAVSCWGYNNCNRLGLNAARALYDRPSVVIESGATGLTAGADHVCAIVGGNPHCWGVNRAGAVGVPTDVGEVCEGVENRSIHTPTQVFDPGLDLVSIVAGVAHTCAIDGDGNLFCWGANNFGQLGVTEAEGSPRPVHMPVTVDLPPVRQVGLGEANTCALTTDGRVYCWGIASGGRLGTPQQDFGCEFGDCQPVPLVLDLLSNVASLAVGRTHACASSEDGRVHCWGGNGSGQVGDDTFEERPDPVQVLQP